MTIDNPEISREKTVNGTNGEHHNKLVADAYNLNNNSASRKRTEQPQETTVFDDLNSAGSHLWNAIWKVNEAEVRAVVGTAQAVQKVADEHPAEAAVTGVAGLPGLAALKVNQQVYAENKDFLEPVVNGVADAGKFVISSVAGVCEHASERLSDNFKNKPLTSALEFVIHPILPMI